MPILSASKVSLERDVLLDGRLALYHEKEFWLAVADLHFGYELSQRAAGRLVPFWGMGSIAERLWELLADYRPKRLIILGDLVHDGAAVRETRDFLDRIREICEPIVIAGNHDRSLAHSVPMLDSWTCGEFQFHHGHCIAKETEAIQIIGHHHPAATVSDGAGLRLKLPAFVQQKRCWIMPAFSPWAAGATWKRDEKSRVWLCSPQRILRLGEN